MEEVTKHFLISGRVQGVGFRQFVRAMAERLRVRGWVRNLSDGRVEALATGSAESLISFEAHLRAGPPNSQVNGLRTDKWTKKMEVAGFEVREDGQTPCCES